MWEELLMRGRVCVLEAVAAYPMDGGSLLGKVGEETVWIDRGDIVIDHEGDEVKRVVLNHPDLGRSYIFADSCASDVKGPLGEPSAIVYARVGNESYLARLNLMTLSATFGPKPIGASCLNWSRGGRFVAWMESGQWCRSAFDPFAVEFVGAVQTQRVHSIDSYYPPLVLLLEDGTMHVAYCEENIGATTCWRWNLDGSFDREDDIPDWQNRIGNLRFWVDGIIQSAYFEGDLLLLEVYSKGPEDDHQYIELRLAWTKRNLRTACLDALARKITDHDEYLTVWECLPDDEARTIFRGYSMCRRESLN